MESCDQPGPEFVDNIDDPCPNDTENDADGDGVCESDEIFGCTEEFIVDYKKYFYAWSYIKKKRLGVRSFTVKKNS